jgi:hypothetical protein
MPQVIDTRNWENILASTLPILGHRNWIVIADSAYPLQISPGIETFVTGSDQIQVIREVLTQLQKISHVRAIPYMDAELDFVPEPHAPGITSYRKAVAQLFAGQKVQALPHEEIIHRLAEAGREFRILLLKTTLTLPYTSLFLELDCGYWSSTAEQELRTSMKK